MNDDIAEPKPSFLSRWRKKVFHIVSNEKEQDWHALFHEGQVDGEDLTEHEKDLISAALQLDTMDAEEVSVARSDIIALPITATFKETLKEFQASRKSRLPVIGDNLDDIRGMVALKEVVAFVGNETGFTLTEVMRPATFIPENLSIDRVLQQMKKNRVQIAIVVDEYGGTAGLLTVKDILAELVGDIEDGDEEIETISAPQSLGTSHYKLDTKMLMEDFRTFFNMPEPIEEDDFETIGGYVLALAGRLPAAGDVIPAPDALTFTVTHSDGRRILGLEVKRG